LPLPAQVLYFWGVHTTLQRPLPPPKSSPTTTVSSSRLFLVVVAHERPLSWPHSSAQASRGLKRSWAKTQVSWTASSIEYAPSSSSSSASFRHATPSSCRRTHCLSAQPDPLLAPPSKWCAKFLPAPAPAGNP
jgi:hypothetical protein